MLSFFSLKEIEPVFGCMVCLCAFFVVEFLGASLFKASLEHSFIGRLVSVVC